MLGSNLVSSIYIDIYLFSEIAINKKIDWERKEGGGVLNFLAKKHARWLFFEVWMVRMRGIIKRDRANVSFLFSISFLKIIEKSQSKKNSPPPAKILFK